MSEQLIDVNELIRQFSLVDLNEAAEAFWRTRAGHPKTLSKPYNLGMAEHILPQLGFMIQGLQLYAGMTVLDFGAGSCYASRILNQLGLRVISTDVSPTALEIGRGVREQMPPFGDVPEHVFSTFDGERFDLPEQSVDRIFCLDAFHHVPSQDGTLCEMARVLKDGGIAGFCEPGPTHSKTAEAQHEMRNNKVIENDIVLSDIFRMSQAYGFTEMKVAFATIHPWLVPLADVDAFPSRAEQFTQGVYSRTAHFPIFFLYKGDPTIRDSRNRAGLTGRITLRSPRISVASGEPVRVTIDVVNTSAKRWLASGTSAGCVNVGAMLREQTDSLNMARSRAYRSSLSRIDIEAGGCVGDVEVNLGVLEPGEYLVDIDLVSEHVCWFNSLSETRVTLPVSVHA